MTKGESKIADLIESNFDSGAHWMEMFVLCCCVFTFSLASNTRIKEKTGNKGNKRVCLTIKECIWLQRILHKPHFKEPCWRKLKSPNILFEKNIKTSYNYRYTYSKVLCLYTYSARIWQNMQFNLEPGKYESENCDMHFDFTHLKIGYITSTSIYSNNKFS